jgi:hypothetical protein
MSAGPLIPADVLRCQAMVPTGHSFMTLGGRPGRERCRNTPTVIAIESEPGVDGLRGSMSLCDDCRGVLVKQCGESFATFEPITGVR